MPIHLSGRVMRRAARVIAATSQKGRGLVGLEGPSGGRRVDSVDIRSWVNEHAIWIGTAVTCVTAMVGGILIVCQNYYDMRYRQSLTEIKLSHEREWARLKMTNERDQMELAQAHVKAELHEAILQQQRHVFDMLFHGDYELFRADLREALKSHISAMPAEEIMNAPLLRGLVDPSNHFNPVRDSISVYIEHPNLGHVRRNIIKHHQLKRIVFYAEDHWLIPATEVSLVLKGRQYRGTSLDKTLQELGVRDGDVIRLCLEDDPVDDNNHSNNSTEIK
eukprot:Hpha_TRINITY_DN18847_c0_g1::TRINITY_DN18847_c0_g1_i1::g.26350::m.26350